MPQRGLVTWPWAHPVHESIQSPPRPLTSEGTLLHSGLTSSHSALLVTHSTRRAATLLPAQPQDSHLCPSARYSLFFRSSFQVRSLGSLPYSMVYTVLLVSSM